MQVIISQQIIQSLALIGLLVLGLNFQVDSLGPNNQDGEAPDSCHLRELELCSMGLVSIFQNPNGLPQTSGELKRQCEFFNESIKCHDRYSNNCLTSDQFAFVHLFAKNAFHVVGEFCRDDSELRTNYSNHVECLREIQRKFQKNCLTDFQVGFEGIHKMTAGDRLTTACCNLNRMKECLLRPITEECGTPASEMIEKLLITISGTWFTLPCREYDAENPECKRLLPKINTKPHTGRNISAISRVISGFTNIPAQM